MEQLIEEFSAGLFIWQVILYAIIITFSILVFKLIKMLYKYLTLRIALMERELNEK